MQGTTKYPDENEWEAWLAEHGGSSNASTDSEFTVFQFDVQHAFLFEALDRYVFFPRFGAKKKIKNSLICTSLVHALEKEVLLCTVLSAMTCMHILIM